jgi:hypothetical protein
MSPENQKCLLTILLEDLELEGLFLRLSLVDHMHKIMCEDKWDTFPTKTKLLFEMAQDMSKINMKQLKE